VVVSDQLHAREKGERFASATSTRSTQDELHTHRKASKHRVMGGETPKFQHEPFARQTVRTGILRRKIVSIDPRWNWSFELVCTVGRSGPKGRTHFNPPLQSYWVIRPQTSPLNGVKTKAEISPIFISSSTPSSSFSSFYSSISISSFSHSTSSTASPAAVLPAFA
jgi:hypothetical protein